MTDPKGKIIEVDFVNKKLLFKFGYYTNLQMVLELEKKLESAYQDICEITEDADIRYKSKLLFKQLIDKLIDGN